MPEAHGRTSLGTTGQRASRKKTHCEGWAIQPRSLTITVHPPPDPGEGVEAD